VRGRDVAAALAQEHLDVKRAARVRADQELRVGGEHRVHLARSDGARTVRLEQVVDAGAAAALLRVGQIRQRDARDRGQELARLRADPLRVLQVTRVVVGEPDRDRVARGERPERDQELAHVDHPGRHRRGAGGPGRIAGQEAPPLLHGRAAPGRVDDHLVGVDPLERGDGLAGQRARLAVAAGVERERAAAAEAGRHHHLAPLGAQHAQRGLVDLGEVDALHAAGQERHARAPRAVRRRPPRQPRHHVAQRHRRHERLERAHPAGQEPHQPQPVRQPAQPGPRVEELPDHGQPQPARVREEPENQPAEEPIGGAAPVALFHLGPRLLDESLVVHARRTGSHAGHAAQAAVEVTDHLARHRLSLRQQPHEVDAPARRVHLFAPRLVRRTGRQAEPAVDAAVDERALRHLQRRTAKPNPGQGRISGAGRAHRPRAPAAGAGRAHRPRSTGRPRSGPG
jgi:hypothetical protein